jgi:HTH-type transcriptional regulator/antitoxin HigA
MKDIVPIRNEAAYNEAIAEVRRLWGAEPGTKEGNRLDVLMVLVDDYENKNHAIEPPDPIEAIQIRMQAMGLERADLGKMLGIASGRLSEILNRRRRLTIEMMRVLAAELKLSESCLIKPYEIIPACRGPRARQPEGRQHKPKVAA